MTYQTEADGGAHWCLLWDVEHGERATMEAEREAMKEKWMMSGCTSGGEGGGDRGEGCGEERWGREGTGEQDGKWAGQ